MVGYIYKTTNLVNGKIYIGQKKLDKFLPTYFGSGTKITNAIKKYGKQNFKVELIESCSSLESLDDREIFWIKFYDSTNRCTGYNIMPGGHFYTNNTIDKLSKINKGKILSEEHKQKISNTLKGRPKESCGMYGKFHSDETKKKMSAARKGIVFSEETRRKMSENNSKPVMNLDTMEVFKSVKDAKKHYPGNIYRCCEGTIGVCHNYHWAYLDKDGNPILDNAYTYKGKPNTKSVQNIETGEIFESMAEASRIYNAPNIVKCCKGNAKTSGGYHWRYYEKQE